MCLYLVILNRQLGKTHVPMSIYQKIFLRSQIPFPAIACSVQLVLWLQEVNERIRN